MNAPACPGITRGQPCVRPIHARGLCSTHYEYAYTAGQIRPVYESEDPFWNACWGCGKPAPGGVCLGPHPDLDRDLPRHRKAGRLRPALRATAALKEYRPNWSQ